MERWMAGAVVVLFVAAVLALMFRAWARRRRSQEARFPLPAVPAQLGAVGASRVPPGTTAFDAQFVAVTRAGAPLERIAAHGLGYRAQATAVVVDRPEAAGLLLEVAGSPPLWLDARALRGVGRGTWAIDRVVEPGGLVVVTAEWNGLDVDVYLGPQFAPASAAFIAAVEALLAAHPAPGAAA